MAFTEIWGGEPASGSHRDDAVVARLPVRQGRGEGEGGADGGSAVVGHAYMDRNDEVRHRHERDDAWISKAKEEGYTRPPLLR